jgi:GT2 family glycosyltransferase
MHAPHGNLCELTVAVCTRNRAEDIRECVRSVLTNAGSGFELLVIDQSDEGATSSLDEFALDSRLRHHRTATRGLSRARNEVLKLARSELIAFTDDDCRVNADWVARVTEFFSLRSDVALAFGRVEAPPELMERGHIATFEPEETTYRARVPSPMEPWGIGACMVLRRQALALAGPFDPALGAGAAIPAGEELDFTIRVLGAGLTVATTAEFAVTHLGLREHDAARKLFLGYVQGAGAAYAKNVRLRTPGAALLFARWIGGVSREVLRAALTGRRPLGVGLLVAGLRGSARALRLPIERPAPATTSNGQSSEV